MKKLAVIALAGLGVAAMPPRVEAQSTSADVSAQTNYVPSSTVERAADRPQGWSYAVTLAANLNVASNRDVVGQLNGNSLLFGASALLGTSFVRERHEWLNTGTLNEAWSRTPTLDRFVKSNDVLELQSLYNFFLRDWTGPFARLAVQTALFKTDRITAGTATYVREDDPTETQTSSRLRLSDSFQPFTLNESLGWFFQPLRSEPANIYARVGFGGRHTFADGARSVTADAGETVNVPYTVLTDVHQGGAELFAGLDGKEIDGRILYSLGATVLFPFINNDDTDRDVIELTRVALAGALGMQVVTWMSVNYQLKVVRDPQLVENVQVQNAVLLSFQYTRATPKPEEAKEEELSPEAQARIRALEARALEAEQRAAAAEARSAVAPTVVSPTESAPPPPPAPAVEPAEPASAPVPIPNP